MGKLFMYRNEQKIALQKALPNGLLASKKWLFEQGFSRHSLDNQVKSGYWVSLVSGLYLRADTVPVWQGVVCSLQRMMPGQVVLGGLSALSLQGFAHYLESGPAKCFGLYSVTKAPGWLNRVLSNTRFVWHNSGQLWSEAIDSRDNLLVEQVWREDLPPLQLSCPERAVLELLAEVPVRVSFEHADALMQGLTSLSPRKLQFLLEHCESVKVKRLFFWLAERQGFAWLSRLDAGKIDFGSGKRMLCKGGRLVNKYQITVPAEMAD